MHPVEQLIWKHLIYRTFGIRCRIDMGPVTEINDIHSTRTEEEVRPDMGYPFSTSWRSKAALDS